MFEVRDLEGVRILRLAYGKANLLDIELLGALDEHLMAAAKEADAVVLTGSGHIFSAGVDLFRVLDGGKPYLSQFLPALSATIERLFTFPKPMVAAVNGHAIAGGCVLACACDVRIGTDSGRIGVPELKVGVPFPTEILEIVRYTVGESLLRELVLAGETYSGQEALARGLFDRLVDAAELIDGAVLEARALASIGAWNFDFTKRQLRHAVLATIREQRAESDQEILDQWSEPATAQRIRDYLDRTLGRR